MHLRHHALFGLSSISHEILVPEIPTDAVMTLLRSSVSDEPIETDSLEKETTWNMSTHAVLISA